MYEQYWELKHPPFANDAAPEFFYRSQSHHATLLKLQYLVEHGLGAGLLVGGVGYGKTYLAHLLAEELAEKTGPFVHLVYPQLSADELMAYLAAELGGDPVAAHTGEHRLDCVIRQIEDRLSRLTALGRQPVIVIDEAHLIEQPRTFSAIQLLLNFCQPPKVSFSLILIGDQELVPRVQRLRSLDERMGIKCVLQPFTQQETSAYVAHRLKVAGGTRNIFDASALDALFEMSAGVPRRLNRLCDLALLVGYADQLSHVSANEIEAVAKELTIEAAA